MVYIEVREVDNKSDIAQNRYRSRKSRWKSFREHDFRNALVVNFIQTDFEVKSMKLILPGTARDR